MTARVTEGVSKFQDDGYALVCAGLDFGALFELGTLLDTKHPGERNLLDVLAIRQLACSEAIRKLARSVLGDDCLCCSGHSLQQDRWSELEGNVASGLRSLSHGAKGNSGGRAPRPLPPDQAQGDR